MSIALKLAACKRCGVSIRSFSPMRKWCVECRRTVSLEQAKLRKGVFPDEE